MGVTMKGFTFLASGAFFVLCFGAVALASLHDGVSTRKTADNPNGCSFDGITDDCKAFDPAKAGSKIEVTKDTAIPNFAALKRDRDKTDPKDARKKGVERGAM